MQKKTLGGDRLGAGKKMQVELHGYERSTHDLGYLWRSTMSAGTLVPFMSEIALPGDTFDIDLDCDIKTHPTVGPLFGSYKIQLDVFQAPIRLYNSLLHNNMLGIGMDMSQVKLPQIALKALPIDDATDKNISQINPSSIMAYLGIMGIGNPDGSDIEREFNAIPLLAYWEIYKNYYSNKQEKIGAVIHISALEINQTIDEIEVAINGGNTYVLAEFPDPPTDVSDLTPGTIITVKYTGAQPTFNTVLFNLSGHGTISLQNLAVPGSINDTVPGEITFTYNFAQYGMTYLENWKYVTNDQPITGEPEVATFPLDDIDKMRKKILAEGSTVAPFLINDVDLLPYNWVHEQPVGIPNLLSSQEGLGLKTYQSDLFNNWLETEWIGYINQTSAVSTVGNSFTIDQLNLSQKVYEMLNRIAVSGGSYDDWLDAVYDHDRIKRAESPIYHGGLIRELVFQEVVSNSESEEQPLGTLAGKGIMSGKKKGGKVVIRVDEPSYIIGIISLTPRVDYSQGNKWDAHLKTMDDLHKPALDEIGFQDLITEQMAWWDTKWDAGQVKWVQKSAGKQPAWINYMTNVNQTRGNFAIQDNEMFMTLNRRYEFDETEEEIADLTTYIDPSKYNFIFAQTALDAQNFWAQISVDITARRKMSAKVMPNL